MREFLKKIRSSKRDWKVALAVCVWAAAFWGGQSVRSWQESWKQGGGAEVQSEEGGTAGGPSERSKADTEEENAGSTAKKIEMRPNTRLQTEVESRTNKKLHTEPETKPNMELHTEPETKPNMELQTKTETGPNMELQTETERQTETEKDYIRWVEFNPTKEAMQQAYGYDLAAHESDHPLNWIELLAYLGAKYGGDFSGYRPSDLSALAEKLQNGEKTMEQLTADMKYYPYYLEAYTAVLGGMVGEYETADGTGGLEKKYGLKAFHPIAKGFPYSDYDDFGVSRTYGYRRNHLGHDMMGQVGTPIIAVESGYVAAIGWNQYGGWRIGINSFDGKRYYYYAHLRQNFPYAKWLEAGSTVQAGDVIGYMGRTGYSTRENVNNIDTYHLHFGLQLIFDESQREGNHEIWINPYEIVRFLYQNQSETVRDEETKEWSRAVQWRDPEACRREQEQEQTERGGRTETENF